MDCGVQISCLSLRKLKERLDGYSIQTLSSRTSEENLFDYIQPILSTQCLRRWNLEINTSELSGRHASGVREHSRIPTTDLGAEPPECVFTLPQQPCAVSGRSTYRGE